MSLRRKSCDACYTARRKCDLDYPVCTRCQRTKKICHYIYVPPNVLAGPSSPAAVPDVDEQLTACGGALGLTGQQNLERPLEGLLGVDLNASPEFENFSPPSLLSPSLGVLGDLAPISGRTTRQQWVLEQLKDYTRAFVQDTQTAFIHKYLYHASLPSSMRAAFGVSAASLHLNGQNQALLFRCIDEEIAKLVRPPALGSLSEELAKLQAMVLYQQIRLFSGNLQQRIVFENQETLMARLSLQLLLRYDTEVRRLLPTWTTWIVGESIRRTCLISFMLYGVYSIFKHGVCLDLPTLATLQISQNPACWKASAEQGQHSVQDRTISYIDWTTLWHEDPQPISDQFEKLLLVACEGVETVEAMGSITLKI